MTTFAARAYVPRKSRLPDGVVTIIFDVSETLTAKRKEKFRGRVLRVRCACIEGET